MKLHRSLSYAIALAGVSVLTLGCSGGTTVSPAPTVTVTAPAPVPSQTPVAEQPIATEEALPAPPAAEPETTNITVPKGVGLNYQQAQDLWRGAGLIVMPATDATGANRLPVIDSNWIVLSQRPKAGTKVAAGSDITATVKKYTDN